MCNRSAVAILIGLESCFPVAHIANSSSYFLFLFFALFFVGSYVFSFNSKFICAFSSDVNISSVASARCQWWPTPVSYTHTHTFHSTGALGSPAIVVLSRPRFSLSLAPAGRYIFLYYIAGCSYKRASICRHFEWRWLCVRNFINMLSKIN